LNVETPGLAWNNHHITQKSPWAAKKYLIAVSAAELNQQGSKSMSNITKLSRSSDRAPAAALNQKQAAAANTKSNRSVPRPLKELPQDTASAMAAAELLRNTTRHIMDTLLQCGCPQWKYLLLNCGPQGTNADGDARANQAVDALKKDQAAAVQTWQDSTARSHAENTAGEAALTGRPTDHPPHKH